MSDTIDEADDRPDGSGGRGVPPGPSVTPGSAPPPPTGAGHQTWSRRGCFVASLVAGVVAVLALAVLVVVLVVAKGWLGAKVDDLAKKRQEIVAETGIETGSTDVVHPPQRDISIGTCENDADGGVRASGNITNWTDTTSDYRVSLSFRDGNGGALGTEFGSTVITVEGVDPHATTSWSASVPVRPDGSYTCRVVRIDRWHTGEAPPPDGGS